MSSAEIWRPVVGHEGAYEVSDQGRVRSLDRVIVRSNGHPQTLWGRVKTPTAGRYGHLTVFLGTKCRYVHQLVLEAFVGPRPARATMGLHNNDIPDDNRPENLRWGTAVDNNRDRVRNGNDPQLNKSHCPWGHLLVSPNLVEAALPHRECKACNRARPWCRRKRIPHLMQQVSDDRYARIMGHKEVV